MQPRIDRGRRTVRGVTTTSTQDPATRRQVTGTAAVAAPPEEVFELLATPRRHPEVDGSGTVRGALRGPARLTLGATFGMRMRQVLPYPIRNTVVEFEEGRLIAWRHVGRHVWRWQLAAVPGGTRVTETFDWSDALSPLGLEVAGFPVRNAAAIEASLRLLCDRFGALEPGPGPGSG